METNNDLWRIIGASVRGANHERQNKPNQDAIAWMPEAMDSEEMAQEHEAPLVISIADGHGSEKYFRSDIGAKHAVEIANDVLYRFAQGKERLSFSQIEAESVRLPYQIITQWNHRVKTDWEEHQGDEQVKEWLDNHPRDRSAISASPTMPYGTTLLSVLITERFILYSQIGDGDIIVLTSDGIYTDPIPADKRNFADEAVSLYNASTNDFNIQLQELSAKRPALILLATDGYSNSFTEKRGFYKVATDIFHVIQSAGEEGLQTVANNLQYWLTKSTQSGSGDDISAGILWRMSAFQELVFDEDQASSNTEAIQSSSPNLPVKTLTNLDDGPTLPAPATYTAS
ncbi:MAG TPA: PP2C family serine/threonine-protein phosphatase [Ktedonobacteraceae bacterium]|nr:PP2C family serine/threonine-protein phosphatase [Ktedonobacteraceae bacterium]